MKNKILMLILLMGMIIILIGCKKEFASIPEPLSTENQQTELNMNDITYCEKDEDCVLSKFLSNSCCEALSCWPGESINLKEKKKREEWRKTNCNFNAETKFVEPKWNECSQSPYFARIECDMSVSIGAFPSCKNNKCITYYKK